MVFKRNSVISAILGIISLFFFAMPVSAHVIVYPHQVGIAATQDFTVSVPNERGNPVTSVRLLMPNGLSDVSPNALPGWNITIKSKRKGDNAVVSEIDWNNGSIPVGQREEFVFQAQVPPTPTTLAWIAYQTYSDGTVVSWNVDPSKMESLSDAQQDSLADKENKGEYSTTQVINDLEQSNDMTNSINSAIENSQVAELFSGLALVLSAMVVVISLKRRK
jgi:uncharacterized protein YcnI